MGVVLHWLGLLRTDSDIWHRVYIVFPRRDTAGDLIGPGFVFRRRAGWGWQYKLDAANDRDWFAEW